MEKHKNIPSLRFPEFNVEWSGKIMIEVADKITDGTHDTPKQVSVGIPYLTAIHIKDGFIDYENCYYLTNEDHEKIFKRCNPEKGDLLIVNIGAGTATCARNNVDYEFSMKNVALIKPKKNIIDSFFLEQIQRKNSAKMFNQLTSGGAQPFLSLAEIGKLKLKIPSLHEQTKIATFLTAVDERLSQLKKKKSLLEQYKKGVMQKIFDQEIRFKDDRGNEFPDWEVTKFGSLYSFKATNSFSRDNLNYESGEVKNIHYGDIHTKFKPLLDTAHENIPYINNEMDISKIPNENYCKAGDLVIADASEDYNDIGKAIEVCNLNNEKVVAGLHTILAKPDLSKIALGFGAFLMKAEYIHFQVRIISQGTKVLGLSSNRLSGISVKLPCVNEQTKIANFLSAIDEKISQCDTQITKTEQYKKGLLQKMFV